MDVRLKSILTGLTISLILVIQPFAAAQQPTQDNNIDTSSNDNSKNRNNTRSIVDLKNHTVTLIDTRTNETISVKNFTPKAINATTTDTLTRNAVNATSSGMPEPENVTIKEKLANTSGNASNINLTAKFNSLQGK